jgi:hypothetical protein
MATGRALKMCPKCNGELRQLYKNDELTCIICGYADYSYFHCSLDINEIRKYSPPNRRGHRPFTSPDKGY